MTLDKIDTNYTTHIISSYSEPYSTSSIIPVCPYLDPLSYINCTISIVLDSYPRSIVRTMSRSNQFYIKTVIIDTGH